MPHRKVTTKNCNYWLIVSLLLSGMMNSAHAGSASHYTPGVLNIRDFFVPAPGLYGIVYNYWYTSDQFNDANGNAVNSITIRPGPGPGLTLKPSVNLDLYALSPALIWVTPWEPGGLKFSAYIAPTFANSNIDAEISSLTDRGVNASTSTFGVGDLFVQPIWLGYTKKHWDFSLAYGFYAPVGGYNTVTVRLPIVGPITTTSPDNIGLGFWTHQIQGAIAMVSVG